VTGVDASPSMLSRCANRARKIPLVLADFWQPLSFADGSFDAVIALHGSLAHPPNETALGHLAREVLRILAPGGVFIAEVPSPGWLALVDRGEAVGDGMRTVRSGPNRCLHEDLTAGLAVEATVLSPAAWQAELGRPFAVTVHELTEVEQLVIARIP
jgi:SAM-dependent methyltransferase